MDGFVARNFIPPTIPVARPRLPDAAAILPYLQEIDSNGYYANHGPLWLRLNARLADHWGITRDEVALASNATAALTLALQASSATPGGECLLPSWTFAATAGAVRQAGLRPYFVDVRPGDWAPDPAAMSALAIQRGAAAIVVVAPFGAPLDSAAWDAVAAATGLPVILDAAAAFDTLRRGGPMRLGQCPAVVSLHATKVFGVGEAGAVLSRDPEWLERFRRLTNFGFLGSRESVLPGINAKISEYTAAVGLAGLDGWAEARGRWAAVTRVYGQRLRSVPGLRVMPRFGVDWVSSTLNVVWPAERLDAVAELAALGVGTLRWWGDGCHAQPAFRSCEAGTLAVTDELARRVVGLPFWQDMTGTQVEAVCAAVSRLCSPVKQRGVRKSLAVA